MDDVKTGVFAKSGRWQKLDASTNDMSNEQQYKRRTSDNDNRSGELFGLICRLLTRVDIVFIATAAMRKW